MDLREQIVRALRKVATRPEACADAVMAVVGPEIDRLAELENALTWNTTCTGCARLLESGYAETMRAEQAEAANERVKDPTETLLKAQEDMLGDWAESALPGTRLSDRQQELWRNLHEAADQLREALDQPGDQEGTT